MKDNLPLEIADAMWAGDVARLHELAPCRCCCSEHTFPDCPARIWYGCRASFAEREPDQTQTLES
jgi:hypothetical protein